MKPINVLVFPAGEVNSMELHDALSTCVNVNLFGLSSIDRHGGYVFENYSSDVPLIDSPLFFNRFNEYIEKNKIDLIFPTQDIIALFLVRNQNKIKAKIISGDIRTCEICFDKKETYNLFADCDFTPKTYSFVKKFPIFVKPRIGRGSIGAFLATKEEDLGGIIRDDYVFCEYLSGDEYTVDCLTDRFGKLIYVSPRTRGRVLAGMTAAGETVVADNQFIGIAEKINSRMNFLGLWCFQVKKDSANNLKLLEISTRIPCGMALTRAKNVNLPLLSVYIAMGLDVSVSPNNYQVKMDSTLIRRFNINVNYDTVYIDFDDTIIVRGKINLKAIWFLYQCKNKGKRIILISKHSCSIRESLNKFNIDTHIFDEIIQIPMSELKSKFITERNAIFIDNAFVEREDVALRCKIPVFDVDCFDFLMDWRM